MKTTNHPPVLLTLPTQPVVLTSKGISSYAVNLYSGIHLMMLLGRGMQIELSVAILQLFFSKNYANEAMNDLTYCCPQGRCVKLNYEYYGQIGRDIISNQEI